VPTLAVSSQQGNRKGLFEMAAVAEDRGALRPNEAARWLSCSRDTVDRLCQSGDLRSFTVGRARYIAMRELERFIADREAATSGGAT
jgi:excisionase family DNA binding protein